MQLIVPCLLTIVVVKLETPERRKEGTCEVHGQDMDRPESQRTKQAYLAPPQSRYIHES